MNNIINQEQTIMNKQHQNSSACTDDQQGWCVVKFKLMPITIKYPLRPPTLPPSIEERKQAAMKKERKLVEEEQREHAKRLKNLRIASTHHLFDVIPDHINEKNIYF